MLVGLFIRNVKAYVNIKFVPMAGLDYDKSSNNFVTYIGENGIGKSSILEALDSFFNNKPYIINKNVTGSSYNEKENKFPFIVPIFLLEKQKISDACVNNSENIDFLEKVSDYFWSVKFDQKPSFKDFFEIRNSLQEQHKEQYYIIIFGERIDINSRKPFFPSFANNDKSFPYHKSEPKVLADGLNFIKELYSYVYFPIEIEAESFTKLETVQMQKIIGKKLKTEIRTSLKNIKQKDIDNINNNLLAFLNSIKDSFGGQYEYKAVSSKKINITENDLVEKVLEAYFEKKVLHKGNKKISELSAGEKRRALISVATAFLNESKSRDKNVIIAIDEPEASLHSSLCYEQFEKLHNASSLAQIFITTHWYGFLPIINYGYAHFIHDKDKLVFDSYLLYDYRAKIRQDKESSQNRIPSDFILKSTNDLVQSIYYSLTLDNSYNWLIVEGITEKMYFEVFFKDLLDKKLRILPLGGFKEVKRVYEFLRLPIAEKNTEIKGKVFCLIDTDNERADFESADMPNIQIRRLSHNGEATQIHLLQINDKIHFQTDIEQCLNAEIFAETYQALGLEFEYGVLNIKHTNGNTNFIKNLNNTKIDEYFKVNDGKNKVTFAEKYIEILSGKEKPKLYIGSWVDIIRKFLNGEDENIV